MSIGANKALVRRFYDEFVNAGDPGAADALVDAGCVFVFAGTPLPERGPAAFKQMLAALRAAFPDFRTTVEEVVAEGDTVAERVTSRGTHRGEFQGIPPTGKTVELQGLSLFRIEGGKIVENWAMPDMLGLLRQLGAIPTPQPTGS